MRTGAGVPDVDIAITTRELGRMIERASIRFTDLPDEEFDMPLGLGTGAAVIFGATGGVMEATVVKPEYVENDPGCKINELLTLEQIGKFSAQYERGEIPEEQLRYYKHKCMSKTVAHVLSWEPLPQCRLWLKHLD